MTCHMNGRPTWDETIASFVPTAGSIPGMSVVGSAAGHMSRLPVLKAHRISPRVLRVIWANPHLPIRYQLRKMRHMRLNRYGPFRQGAGVVGLSKRCHCKDIKQAAQENFRSVEHMKRYTTQGMATDQGKNSNVAALALLADATGRVFPKREPPHSVPLFPRCDCSHGGRGTRHGFAPERFTTSHAVAKDMAAPMIEAGLWYRPSYFPEHGETTWRQSCDREVMMVRENVGVVMFDLGQNRHSGQGCRETVGFHLYQYVQHTKGWARALWPDAARRWACDG